MSVICFGGFCIPYSVLWPFVVILLKPLWEMLSKVFGWEKPKDCCKHESKASSDATSASISTSTVNGVHHIETEEQFESIKNSDRVSFAKFTATWCKPCQKIKPKYHEIANENSQEASFMVLDVDKCDSIAAEHGAVRIPMFVAFQSGKKLGSISTDEPDKLHAFVSSKLSESSKQ